MRLNFWGKPCLWLLFLTGIPNYSCSSVINLKNESGLVYETNPDRPIVLTSGYVSTPASLELSLPSFGYSRVCPEHIRNEIGLLYRDGEPVLINSNTTEVITDGGIRTSYIHMVIDSMAASSMKSMIEKLTVRYNIKPNPLYAHDITDQIVINPKRCNKNDVLCNFKAPLSPIICPNNTRPGTVFPATASKSEFSCGLRDRSKPQDEWQRGPSICCSQFKSNRCPGAAQDVLNQMFEHQLSVKSQEELDPSKVYCISLVYAKQRAKSSNTEMVTQVPDVIEEYHEDAVTQKSHQHQKLSFSSGNSNSNSKTRVRKSTLKYYLSGGPFNAAYIDGLEHDDQLMINKSHTELKSLIDSNENKIVTLGKKVAAVTSMVESQMCENAASSWLSSIQNKLDIFAMSLKSEIESNVDACQKNILPEAADLASLEHLCLAVVGDTEKCKLSSAYFECELEDVRFSDEKIYILITLTLNLPVLDALEYVKVRAIPIPINSNHHSNYQVFRKNENLNDADSYGQILKQSWNLAKNLGNKQINGLNGNIYVKIDISDIEFFFDPQNPTHYAAFTDCEEKFGTRVCVIGRNNVEYLNEECLIGLLEDNLNTILGECPGRVLEKQPCMASRVHDAFIISTHKPITINYQVSRPRIFHRTQERKCQEVCLLRPTVDSDIYFQCNQISFSIKKEKSLQKIEYKSTLYARNNKTESDPKLTRLLQNNVLGNLGEQTMDQTGFFPKIRKSRDIVGVVVMLIVVLASFSWCVRKFHHHIWPIFQKCWLFCRKRANRGRQIYRPQNMEHLDLKSLKNEPNRQIVARQKHRSARSLILYHE